MKLYQAKFKRGWLARAEDAWLMFIKPSLRAKPGRARVLACI